MTIKHTKELTAPADINRMVDPTGALQRAGLYTPLEIAIDDTPTRDMERRGELLAEILMLKKKSNNGRYDTTWGDKTAIGLFLTVEHIVSAPPLED